MYHNDLDYSSVLQYIYGRFILTPKLLNDRKGPTDFTEDDKDIHPVCNQVK